MKSILKKLLILLSVLISLHACGKEDILDEQRDYALIKAMEAVKKQNRKDIDEEALEKHAIIYEKNKEKGKSCLANTLIGYKLYYKCDYDRSLIFLKKAEANIEYCDSIASFIYGFIADNLSSTDTLLALEYRNKAIIKDLHDNNLRRLPYAYLDKSLLLKGDSARFYLQKSLELFDDWGDKIARCHYAKWHANEMASDSVIAYMKPCFDSLQFTGYASELANAYLRKGNIDSAQIYIDKLSFWEGTKTDFYLRNSQLLTLKGDYKEACKSWENAFNLLLEESKFMLSQRLGAINAEYDLLNAELQNEKQRVRTMRIYNTALMVLVVALGIAIVVIKRYKRNIGEKDVDIAKSKERFNALFEKHKTDYPLNKDSVMTDAMHNLKKLHEAYPSLTKTEISIIWLLFMKCSTGTICELLSISQNYYYQRKSVIYKTFGIKGKGAEVMIENLVKEYIVDNG